MRYLLSIVIPAHNEVERLPRYLPHLLRTLRKYLGAQFEVIVVTDGCTDGTDEYVAEVSRRVPEVKHLLLRRRVGKGRAVALGLEKASGQYLLYVDADGAVPPSEVLRLLLRALETGADIIVGSRWVPGSCPLGYSFTRKLLSRGLNLLVKILIPQLRDVRDTQCGAKLLRREVWERIRSRLYLSDYVMDIELLLRAREVGAQVLEVGILWRHVPEYSKVGDPLRNPLTLLKVTLQTLTSLLHLLLRTSKTLMSRC